MRLCAGSTARLQRRHGTVVGSIPADRVDGQHDRRVGLRLVLLEVGYDSTNAAQRDIAPSCHETSALTITNGGTVSSAP